VIRGKTLDENYKQHVIKKTVLTVEYFMNVKTLLNYEHKITKNDKLSNIFLDTYLHLRQYLEF